SLLATTPAQGVAQIADVVVTTAAGSSATSPADRFTYTNATPAKSCSSALCVVVVHIPVVPYTTSSTMSTACSGCTVTASAGLGSLGGPCGASGQYVLTVGSFVPPTTAVSELFNAFTQGTTAYGAIHVCAQPVLTAAPAPAGTAATAAATPATITLRTCTQTNGTAPCIMDDTTTTTGTRTTRIKLPENQKFKLEVTPVAPTVTQLNPISSGIGPLLQIVGTNTGNVQSVVIGGLRAGIVFRLPKSIVVGIPNGAQSGPVSLITATGVVTSQQVVTIGP
ncbi:MAG TPA: hypothetical protein VIK54_05470, partial [Acidimicrobiia bacterium]